MKDGTGFLHLLIADPEVDTFSYTRLEVREPAGAQRGGRRLPAAGAS